VLQQFFGLDYLKKMKLNNKIEVKEKQKQENPTLTTSNQMLTYLLQRISNLNSQVLSKINQFCNFSEAQLN